MISSPYILLSILLILGLVAKNQSLIIAVSCLYLLRLIKLDKKILEIIQTNGINWGITIMTVAVLMPIATGSITLKDVTSALKSPYSWIALASGVLVSVLGRSGVKLLATSPEITVSLVIGTIVAVSFLRGVAVGPLIGAGIAYFAMKVVDLFYK